MLWLWIIVLFSLAQVVLIVLSIKRRTFKYIMCIVLLVLLEITVLYYELFSPKIFIFDAGYTEISQFNIRSHKNSEIAVVFSDEAVLYPNKFRLGNHNELIKTDSNDVVAENVKKYAVWKDKIIILDSKKNLYTVDLDGNYKIHILGDVGNCISHGDDKILARSDGKYIIIDLEDLSQEVINFDNYKNIDGFFTSNLPACDFISNGKYIMLGEMFFGSKIYVYDTENNELNLVFDEKAEPYQDSFSKYLLKAKLGENKLIFSITCVDVSMWEINDKTGREGTYIYDIESHELKKISSYCYSKFEFLGGEYIACGVDLYDGNRIIGYQEIKDMISS